MKKGMNFNNFKISLANQIKRIANPSKDVYLHLHCITPHNVTYNTRLNCEMDDISAIECGYVFSLIGGGIFYCELHENVVKFIREVTLEEIYLKYTTNHYYFNTPDLRVREIFTKENAE
jgi:hypothetical protein